MLQMKNVLMTMIIGQVHYSGCSFQSVKISNINVFVLYFISLYQNAEQFSHTSD